MPSRRATLSALAAALAGGCLGPATDPEPGPAVTDDRSPTDYTHTGAPRGSEDCSGGFHVSADPFDPAADLPLRLDDAARSLVGDAVQTGAAEAAVYADTPPVADGVYVAVDEAFYETAVREVDRTQVPALVTNVEWERGQTAPEDAEVVAFADLPAADRFALRYGIYGGAEGGEEHGHPSESLSLREVPLPYPDGTADSAFAGDGETWVRWDDRTYRVWTDGETTTSRHRFRLEVTRVAADADAFRSHVADEYLLTLTGLSADERSVLDAAAAGTYEECEPASAGLAALREKLNDADRLPQPMHDAWYVAHDEQRYALTLTRWVH